MVLYRDRSLCFEAVGAAIPGEGLVPGEVVEAGRVALEVAAVACRGAGASVSERAGGIVTTTQPRESSADNKEPKKSCLPSSIRAGVIGDVGGAGMSVGLAKNVRQNPVRSGGVMAGGEVSADAILAHAAATTIAQASNPAGARTFAEASSGNLRRCGGE